MSAQPMSLRPGQRVRFLPKFYNYVSGHMLFLPGARPEKILEYV